MKKNIVTMSIILLILNIGIAGFINLSGLNIVNVRLSANEPFEFQIFYLEDDKIEYNEMYSDKTNYEKSNDIVNMQFKLKAKNVTALRLDFDDDPIEAKIYKLEVIDNWFVKRIFDENAILSEFKNMNQTSTIIKNNELHVKSSGNDAFIASTSLVGKTTINNNFIIINMYLLLIGIVFIVINVNKRRIINMLSRNKGDETGLFAEIVRYANDNRAIIAVNCLFILLAHGVLIFYYKMGVDSELSSIKYDKVFNGEAWIEQGDSELQY